MAVAFRDVTKVFADGTVALDRLSFAFEKGEFIVLLGPSGSGKTTACRLLAGLEQPTSGHIEVDGRDITPLPPRARGMSMVFQNYALYGHRSVFENIAYPLRIRGTPKAEIERMVREVAAMLHIERLLERRPRQLSGGEAQRVAVARALVWNPELCLMDEPLSNLDALLRLQTRTELKRLHHDLKKTFVYVTHDQEEAMTLGSRIAVLNDGRLVQFDAPKRIYHEPATRFVAEFIGRPAMNTVDGEVRGGTFRAGPFALPVPGRAEGPIVLGIRPEALELDETPGPETPRFVLDVIERVEPDTLLFASCGAVAVVARVMKETEALRLGAEIALAFPPAALHFFDAATGVRLP